MTQEEKFERAIKLADAMYYAAQMLSTDASHLKKAMEDWWQFENVELKESEDERIRERLIEFFKDWGKTRSHCWSISISDILAWLEKQR